ncbi:MAG: hypothetical protein K5656_11005 [Lachnospiraceae bacterium]|nr:hypothetical protein [Lachnospiraceae bacterium]
MKKYITERKWNKLYDKATDGFYEKKNADGSEVYYIEGFRKYMRAVNEFPEYRIIGIRHQLGMLKDKWKNYKLRHLSIGKVRMLSKDNNIDFKIDSIDWNVHWQTNLYLTVIIRDYLRFFIENTMVIGNCVIENKDPLYEATDEDWEKWKNLVNSVADEFDELHKLDMRIEDAVDITELQREKDTLLKKAFSDLTFIYEDLWW